jgi:multidrug resistance efflux pump
MPIKLKTVTVDNKTYAEVIDGKPVYVDDDNKEIPFDAPHAMATIERVNASDKKRRMDLEAAEAKLKDYEGIEDAEGARKALEMVKNLSAGELKTVAQVEEIKTAAAKAAEDRVAAANKASKEALDKATEANDKLTKQLYSEKIGGSFARSKYVAEKTILPGPAAEKIFGENFRIEDGKIVAYGPDGNKVYSRAKPGNDAEFEEALEMLVDIYPFRDSILKGTGGGTGAQNGRGNGAGNSGNKVLVRSEFDKLDAINKAAKMAEGYTVTDG